MSVVFLSPTEHDLRSTLIRLGIAYKHSALCELNGVDCLVVTKRGFIGFQRKTLIDLYTSLNDGRLAREIAQIRGSRLLYRGCLVLEYDSRRRTVDDGSFLDAPFSAIQLRHLLLKLQLSGILVLETPDIVGTARTLRPTAEYVVSDRATDLMRPKPASDTWGRRTSRDFGIHVLQSFASIGPKTAATIYDRFGLPLRWTITSADLQSLPGIGKVTAERLMDVLDGPTVESPSTEREHQ